jgi:hypothetical protein
MISADLSTQPQANLDLFTNLEAIGINQDPLGAQAKTTYRNGDQQVLLKPLADTSRAVGVLNRGTGSQTITATSSMIGLPPRWMTVRNVWRHATQTSRTITVTLAPTSSYLFRVCPRRRRDQRESSRKPTRGSRSRDISAPLPGCSGASVASLAPSRAERPRRLLAAKP